MGTVIHFLHGPTERPTRTHPAGNRSLLPAHPVTKYEIRDPAWLLPICGKIASGLKRPPTVEYEDVISDAAEIILRVAKDYPRRVQQGLVCGFDPWIIITTRWKLRTKYAKEWDWINRRSHPEDATTHCEWLDALAAVTDDEERRILRVYLDLLASELPPTQREVYHLLMEGLTSRQMIRRLGIKEKTVEQRLQRMRDAMRKFLEESE